MSPGPGRRARRRMRPGPGRRAFVVVLDACGVGALPDAADYGDAGANTLEHVADAAGGLALPVLEGLGLGRIVSLAGVAPSPHPVLHGRLHALGPGKDSATGHWELMGAVPPRMLPTYPDGFPAGVVDRLERATGRQFLCNRPYNGLDALTDFGAEHLATGHPILYTSQDSVLQLAVHDSHMSVAELQALCVRVRELMTGPDAVGRVIARPFAGDAASGWKRLPGRRDLSLPPPGTTYLEALAAAGIPVHSVGKVAELFDGRGVEERHPGHDSARALESLDALIDDLDHGLVFANLVDTDQLHGHRKDIAGFARALEAIDSAAGGWLARLDSGRDLLVLCADHGCDPAHPGSDHTREHAPLLARFAGHGGRRHDGPLADVGASALAWLAGTEEPALPGSSFLS